MLESAKCCKESLEEISGIEIWGLPGNFTFVKKEGDEEVNHMRNISEKHFRERKPNEGVPGRSKGQHRSQCGWNKMHEKQGKRR